MNLFDACPRYLLDRLIVSLDRQKIADCVSCGRQYEAAACPTFRARLLRQMKIEERRYP